MAARILVIEDNPASLELESDLLQASGHALLQASDGVEGLETARRLVPDLIICDVQLPRMDGYELARRLKCDAALHGIPLLAVTAHAMVGDRDRLLMAGFDGYLVKPIVPETFVAQVEAFLPPGQRTAPAPSPAAGPAVRKPAPASVAQHASIVVVDKSPANLSLMRCLLEPFGYEVVAASSIAEALALAQQTAPDLILSDLHMPEGGAEDFIRVEEVLALARSSAPVPVPPEVDREHLRMLTDTLARKVKELDVEVAHRRRAEAALRERDGLLHILSRKLLNAQEAERRRIARELHDEVGQTLTTVKIQLHGLMLNGDAAVPRPGMERCIATVEQLLGQVRTLSVDLRPSLLDDLGLVAALRSYVARQARLANFTAKMSADELGSRMDPEVETACFRVAQEALTNVIRHAGAKTVLIDLRRIDNHLHVVIRDDGSGFDVTAAQARAVCGDSLGLLGMQERVTLLGGRFRIRSMPGRGTTVHASLPLVAPAGDAPEAGR